MDNLLKMLSGGDRRSIGKADAVVDVLRKEPVRFQEVFKGLYSQDPVVRMRAAESRRWFARAALTGISA